MLEERRHQRALNDDILLWCLVIKPYFPWMYKDILDTLEPWMLDIPLECPPAMTAAEFAKVVAFNNGVAERQSAWEEDSGEALRGLVQLVLEFNADTNPPAPKRSAPDCDDEAEPPAKRGPIASPIIVDFGLSTAASPPPGPPPLHPAAILRPAPHSGRLSLMATGGGHVSREAARAEDLRSTRSCRHFSAEQGAAEPV
ncbi:hypothetical protein CYLTODRAFT_458711 [Cylindrobasidium torrendii FP15055 ss-10]|uniref:Uncharacterized protein n=1 Tax=Cylindrobasidium torrendii FP15055 ss-10 TaxID=1314674 RepID=A0A0D7AXS5_9AGAR|nr:hypothetical protein CYLTODRAFT_458711 [Cylindrobasidium torrendii FP15055 ss-10]